MSKKQTYRLHAGVIAFLWTFLTLCLTLGSVTVARADDYTIDPVTIDATVEANGVIHVVEERTFNLEGEYHGVNWRIGTSPLYGHNLLVSVSSVGVVQNGAVEPFTLSDSQAPFTYSVENTDTATKIVLYEPMEDQSVTFQAVYDVQNLVVAWQDTAELYWKFVSDGWDVASENVTCTIHLPVPSGQSVEPGQNVRAWGHGTLDARVDFVGNDIVYQVPEVGSDDFAEARVTFPVGWVTLTPSNEAHLPAILTEEQGYADEANARRDAARVATYGSFGLVVALGAASIFYAFFARARYKKSHAPTFQEAYWRDVPSKDHPAVVGMLVSGDKPESKEFEATLMRLTDKHVCGLEKTEVTKNGLFGAKSKDDYRITLDPKVAATLDDPIDVSAVDFLFDDVAPKTPSYQAAKQASLSEEGAETDHHAALTAILNISEMQAMAKKYPARFMEGMQDWQGTVSAEVERLGYHTDDRATSQASLVVALAISVFAIVGGFIAFVLTEAPWWFLLLLLVPLAGAIACGVVASNNKQISSEAVEVRAKALALKRWLQEFTNLDEAIPTDVVLWNQLFVMAVALGVADKVIEQLRVAAPQIIEDPYFYPYYLWYGPYYRGSRSPMHAMNDAFTSSYHASQAAIAASSNASGVGGGGGFSVGGGAGGGGGGGGGAF